MTNTSGKPEFIDLKSISPTHLAKVLGISGEHIRRLKINDVFKPLSDKGHPKYDLADAVKSYVDYVTKGMKPGEEDSVSSLAKEKLFEEVRKLKLENDLKEGTSIPKEDAELAVAEGFAIILSRVQSVPRRMQALLSATLMRIMRDELDQALQAGADRLARLGAIGTGGADSEAVEDPKPRPVGKRKSKNTNRKRRARPVPK